MFTGIIETIGTVKTITRHTGGGRAQIAAAITPECRVGDSIAVDGACLTVTALGGEAFVCDLSVETLERTTLGALRPGARVNLERPLRLGDRLGGHLVTGHVDAVGHIADRIPQGNGEVLHVRFPRDLGPWLVMKGSIAVDGISLTVAVLTREVLGVACIPFTLAHTTLGEKRAGSPVNLETDLIGKYVARILARPAEAPRDGSLTATTLEEYGFA
jgi:riboflavin synthase